MEHIHCLATIGVKIKKQINSNSSLLDIKETYCCIECGQTVEYDCSISSSSSEIDSLEAEMIEDYNYLCMGDIDLLRAIYKKIKNNHPNISVDDMGAYICAALYNMETKEVSKERQKKRVLRLGLDADFNNWNKKFVIHYCD